MVVYIFLKYFEPYSHYLEENIENNMIQQKVIDHFCIFFLRHNKYQQQQLININAVLFSGSRYTYNSKLCVDEQDCRTARS